MSHGVSNQQTIVDSDGNPITAERTTLGDISLNVRDSSFAEVAQLLQRILEELQTISSNIERQ